MLGRNQQMEAKESPFSGRSFFKTPSWLVCLAILSLGIHLADRFDLPLSGTATIQSNTPRTQHLDQDGYQWLPPATNAVVRLAWVPAPQVTPQEKCQQSLHVRWLFDRPPPSA
jgi:hypothetical protein